MTVQWPHLDSSHLDPRFMLVAGFLNDKIKDKNILELNCGNAGLLKYLPKIFARYYCNDVMELGQHRELVQFDCIADDMVPKNLSGIPIDILMCFGISHWKSIKNYTPAEPRSKTIKDTIVTLSRTHKPKYIILENSAFNWRHGNIEGITDELEGYLLFERVFVKSDLIQDEHNERVVEIWVLKC